MREHLDLRDAGRIAARMLTSRWAPTGTGDLDAALTHHDRVLDELARLVQAQITIGSRAYGDGAAGETVAAQELLRVLATHPREGNPFDLAPTQLLREDHLPAGDWPALQRSLLVSAHAWAQVEQSGEPVPGSVRRGVLADVASLAAAVSTLGQDLADALTAHTHRTGLAAQLRSWSAPLNAAAQDTLAHAQRAATVDRWAPHPSIGPRIVPIVRDTQIPDAAVVLARMLHDARPLRLDATSAIELITVHATTTAVVGRYLHASGADPRTGEHLVGHARDVLAATASAGHHLWSRVSHPHEHPLAQARELHHATGAALRPGPGVLAPARRQRLTQIALDYAAVVPAITAGLSARVQAAAQAGQWSFLAPDPTAHLQWQTAGPEQLTALSTALEAAATALASLGPRTLPSPAARADSPLSAHRVLAPLTSASRLRRPPPPPPSPARPRPGPAR